MQLVMNYSNIQVDFVRRTQQNLDYLAQHGIESQKDFNEVTNLINSMLGLICYPNEARGDKIRQLSISPNTNIQSHSPYGDIYLCLNTKGDVSNSFDDIKRHLRNAVCHGRFLPYKTGAQNEIEELRFQDFNGTIKNFDMIMSITQMRKFVQEISNQYLSNISNNNIHIKP
jgi:hypothetical protein